MADNVTGIILLFLAVFLLLRGLPGVVELLRARGWQRAPGTMLDSGVASYQTQATGEQMSANVQQAVFAYRYEVGGRIYTGQRVAFGTPLSFGKGLGAIASAQASRYSPGEEVDVWADPADPSRAVLRRSAPSSVLMTALGVALAIAGALSLAG